MPILISVQKMEANAATTDGLLAVILEIMKIEGGLDDA